VISLLFSFFGLLILKQQHLLLVLAEHIRAGMTGKARKRGVRPRPVEKARFQVVLPSSKAR
jgi:hypothetical protein